jgi:hypothetical protein
VLTSVITLTIVPREYLDTLIFMITAAMSRYDSHQAYQCTGKGILAKPVIWAYINCFGLFKWSKMTLLGIWIVADPILMLPGS